MLKLRLFIGPGRLAARASQAGAGEAGAEGKLGADGRITDLGDERHGFGEVRLRGGDFHGGDSVGELRERVGLGGQEIPGEALVAVRLGDPPVERAELRERRGDGLAIRLGEVAEDRAAGGEVGLGVGGEAPGLREARGHGQPRGRPRLVVAVIAPGGEQDAARFMTYGRPDGFGLVCQRVVEAPGETLPGARARGDEVGPAKLTEPPALFLERMAGVVTPDDWHGVGRRVLREREVFQQDVAPELHGAAAVASERAQFLQMVEVDAMLAAFGDGLLAEALPELPRFVAADVHLAAAEVRQIVVEQRGREVDRGLVGAQRAGEFLELSRERVDPAFGTFGHRAVTRVTKPTLHVAEGVEVRHELDAERGAGVVEFADLRGRQRRGFLPGVFMSAEREGVLDVKLELVDAKTAERADEGQEFGLRRHARARDIEHEAADG